MRWGSRPTWARWLVAVYVVGFLEGTVAHAYFLVAGGPAAYSYAPVPVQLLFHALLLLDPLAALLTVRVHPLGPLLCAGIMLVDLTANWWVQWDAVLTHPAAFVRPVGLLPMTLFGVLVLSAAFPLSRALASTADVNDAGRRRTKPVTDGSATDGVGA